MLEHAFDALLAVAVLWVAWRALGAGDLFRSVVLFIAFGLLMALVWARLAAPDVALAEAAIGAGLAGALLLDAVGEMDADRRASRGLERTPLGWQLTSLLSLGILVALLGYAAVSVVGAGGGLAAAAAERAPETGASHPVTSVLLNFRAYDTLLEIIVLLLAATGVLAIRHGVPVPAGRASIAADPLLPWSARVVAPVMVLTALHLLYLGSRAPGGAFQAGALLGGAGVLVYLAGVAPAASRRVAVSPAPLVVAAACFIIVAAIPLARGGEVLRLRGDAAAPTILALELVVALTTGWTLAVLFAAARPSEQ